MKVACPHPLPQILNPRATFVSSAEEVFSTTLHGKFHKTRVFSLDVSVKLLIRFLKWNEKLIREESCEDNGNYEAFQLKITQFPSRVNNESEEERVIIAKQIKGLKWIGESSVVVREGL